MSQRRRPPRNPLCATVLFTFALNPQESDVFPLIDRWIDAIADRDMEAAADFIFNAESWPLNRLDSAVSAIAADESFVPWAGSQHFITAARDAIVAERFDMPELNDPAPLMSFWMLAANPQLAIDHPNCIGDVLYPLPINGYWSDVNASFHLRQVDADSVALLLHDILAIRDD